MRSFALVFICFTLLFAACSTEEVIEDSIENTTEVTVTTPEVEDEVLVVENETDTIVLEDSNNNTFIEWEEPVVEQSEFFTVTGIAIPAGRDKYAINRFLIETNAEIDETVFFEVSLNGVDTVYDLNTDLNCDSGADLIKARNQFYGVKDNNGSTILCFSAARDMYEYNKMKLVIKNAYEETLFNHTVEAPRLLRSTQTVPLYTDE